MASVSDIEGHHNRREEEEEQPHLVFPVNVHESLKSSGGLKKGEKVGILVSFWIFGCGLLAWFLLGWLRNLVPGGYIWITIGIEIILQLTVGMYILRFALDERAIFQEFAGESQSFANYFKIYKEITAKDGSKYPFDLLEFDDGSYGVFIQCRLGHNTQDRSENTYYVNKEVTEILNKANLPSKIFFHTEMFKGSQAAQDLRDILKDIKDKRLLGAYRDMIQNYLRIAEEESNVLCVTYLIYAPSRIAKDDLLPVMHNIFTAFEKSETVYRQVSALKYNEIVEFLRHYYRLEVLDMGLIRAHIAEKRKKYDCSVTVLKIYGRSGKIYTSSEYKKLGKELINDYGLTSVN